MIRIARFLFAISVIWPLALTIGLSQSIKTAQDDVTEATSKWLKSASTGDQTALNVIMDEGFVATTPAGDVVTKEEIMPDDPSQQVQRLQVLILGSPVVRLYGDTAVLMGRLKSADAPGRDLNGTFVYTRQNGVWKLIALHLSPRK